MWLRRGGPVGVSPPDSVEVERTLKRASIELVDLHASHQRAHRGRSNEAPLDEEEWIQCA